MDTPLGVTFFKKVELYQKISSLDDQAKKMVRKGGLKPFWSLEKRVLKWTYTGHKHLGSPLKTDDFSPGNSNNKLKDFKIKPEEVKGINLTKLLDNFIAHGFATEILEGRLYTGRTPNENFMYLTREGILMGEVLNELNNPFYRISYWIWGKLWGHWGGFILILTLLLTLFKPMSQFIYSLINGAINYLFNIIFWRTHSFCNFF